MSEPISLVEKRKSEQCEALALRFEELAAEARAGVIDNFIGVVVKPNGSFRSVWQSGKSATEMVGLLFSVMVDLTANIRVIDE